MKFIWSFLCMLLFSLHSNAQHGFPEGHWCNTPEGWECKRCRALWGLKNDEKHKVITIPHRGIWGLLDYPESCLHAVQEAYNQGYMFIEIDIILSKDKQLVLCHDQQTNRMTDLPKTFSADGNLYDNGSFFRSLNWNTTTNNSVPDVLGDSYSSFPALKDGYYVDRFDNLTSYKLNLLKDIYEWGKDKELVLTLDIKTGSLNDPFVKQEYLEAIGLCLEAADNAPVIQYHMNPGTYKGNSLWQLEPDNLGIQNIYWIRNVHSGKFLYFSGIEYKDGIPAVQVSSDHNLMHRWILEPVVIE